MTRKGLYLCTCTCVCGVCIILFICALSPNQSHQLTLSLTQMETNHNEYKHKILWNRSVSISQTIIDTGVTTIEYIDLDKEQGYTYPEVVDIRFIVLTYKRSKSLAKCLNKISNVAIPNGEKAAVEIWIDKPEKGDTDKETLEEAKSFVWDEHIVRVHVHKTHAGLYSQWFDTWRPNIDSKEIVLIVEDDLDVSPYSYLYLKKVNKFYKNRTDIAEICLQDENIHYSNGPKMHKKLQVPNSEPVFLYKRPAAWACSPNPTHWFGFRNWYHSVKNDSTFHPYVPEQRLQTSWYKNFEKNGKAHTMWELWFSYYMNERSLYCLYSNLPTYFGKGVTSLSINRREPGMHFSRPSKQINSNGLLLSHWTDDMIKLPKQPHIYNFYGQVVTE